MTTSHVRVASSSGSIHVLVSGPYPRTYSCDSCFGYAVEPRVLKLGIHVRRHVNLIRYFRYGYLESVLDSLEDLLVLLGRNKRNCESLSTEATSTANTMQVLIGTLGKVVVDDNVDPLYIHAATKQVGGDKNALVKVLKLLVASNTLLLLHLTMDADGRETALLEELVEHCGALDSLARLAIRLGTTHKNYDLIEFEGIKEIVEAAIFLLLRQVDVVLLKSVESELCLIVHIDLEGVLIGAEAAAYRANFLAQSGRKHHDLLVVGCVGKDLLNVTAHIELFQKFVALVEDEVLEAAQLQVALTDKSEQTPRGAHNNVRAVVLQHRLVLADWYTSVKHGGLHVREILTESLVLVHNLKCEFTGVAENKDPDLAVLRVKLVKGRKHEHGRLSHA